MSGYGKIQIIMAGNATYWCQLDTLDMHFKWHLSINMFIDDVNKCDEYINTLQCTNQANTVTTEWIDGYLMNTGNMRNYKPEVGIW